MKWKGIFRENSRGNLGSPTISGHRNAMAWSTKFEVTSFTATENAIDFVADDSLAQLQLVGRF